MWQDFAEYILNEVGDEDAQIAEVAVGKFDMIAEVLSSRENITLIKTDINPADESVIKDDITNPDFRIYEGVDMIYSIRPPSELQPHLVNLAQKINCQLIIKPLTNEDLNTPGVKMKFQQGKLLHFKVIT